ncbi:MAG: mannitol dehydrogenase family protein [Pleomorphochaeta sp.]
MKLNLTELQNKKQWTEKGYLLSSYDREKMVKNTLDNPKWVHFGAGNIFRGFPAALMQNLLEKNIEDTGIIVGEGFDFDIIEKIYQPHDNLNLLVTLNADGSIDKKVIDSLAASYKCDYKFSSDWENLLKVFANKSLQMVSFTITEKGYSLVDGKNNYYQVALEDFKNGPEASKLFLSKLTALVYNRYKAIDWPLALVSMDNCSHNGEKLENAVKTIAKEWANNGLIDKNFLTYLDEKVSFPWSMIDKITPRPDASVVEMLKKDGFEDTEIIVTDKNTWIAPFVNAEKPQYLVIEDDFPNGRVALENSGVFFTTRETVNKVEKMKVCTCLNPLHTTLAIYGCLLSYNLISKEMLDPQLKKIVEIIGYEEGMKVVVDPKIINPKDFIQEVLNVRFPNPFMPDTPQRIACDTSQKLSIRFGETIKAYIENPELDVNSLKFIPLVYAGWLRYLMAIDDNGDKFDLSPDPLLESVTPFVKDIKLGDKGPFDVQLKELLSNEKIFGVDLYEVGLASLVLSYFEELIAAKGAVRATLVKYLK